MILTFSVQTPLGPRKSGIPQEVDIPAPVNATRCLLCNDRKDGSENCKML